MFGHLYNIVRDALRVFSDGKEVLVADRISFVRASELALVVCNRNIILHKSSATLKVAGITIVVKLVVVVGIL
jgi:hypothetical protein